MSDYKKYLQPTKFLDYENEEVKKTVKKLTDSLQMKITSGKVSAFFILWEMKLNML
jgi:hypothetical protein